MNPHSLRNQILSLARLPISPLERIFCNLEAFAAERFAPRLGICDVAAHVEVSDQGFQIRGNVPSSARVPQAQKSRAAASLVAK